MSKILRTVPWLICIGLVIGCCGVYSLFVQADNELAIYRDRAQNYEQLLQDQQASIDKAEADVQAAIDLVTGYNEITVTPIGEFFCTAYCTEKRQHICGTGTGITASGQPVQSGVTVAADPDILPYGTVLYIEGVGIRIVQDTGGAVQENQLDVAIDTHDHALKWSGYGYHKVYVLGVDE